MSIRKHFKELERLAEEAGIRAPEIRWNGKKAKHPKLCGLVNRQRIRVGVSGSPSDARALMKARCQFRRIVREAQGQ